MKPMFNLSDPHHFGTRWLAYFDLLGFKELVQQDIVNAVHSYFMSREIVERWARKGKGLELVCFSDTYVLYTADDSAKSFWRLEQAARWIMNNHIQRKMPLRGALSSGEFYADRENNVFIGKALLEAYKFGESQNWIGFVLCRSATKRLTALRLLPSKRLNYCRWRVPLKTSKRAGPKPLYAYAIGVSSPVSGENFYLNCLRDMVTSVRKRKVRLKYNNAIHFLKHFGITSPAEPRS